MFVDAAEMFFVADIAHIHRGNSSAKFPSFFFFSWHISEHRGTGISMGCEKKHSQDEWLIVSNGHLNVRNLNIY